MKEKPDYEKYPISDEEMGERYKNWTESLSRQMLVLYKIGKEVGGQKFVERLKEEYRKMGQRDAGMWTKLVGMSPEEFKDCSNLPKVYNCIDDRFANFWNGYVENTPKAFEKELYTCPVARPWSREPEICELLLGEALKGMAETLNPKFKSEGFTKLLVKGDKCCRYRVEME
ncbi:MAG: hypothetical protein JW891_12580 [Candidatus Lokiarchaeota archaeon]|nr:hypothetical protein [Candidatus Lokiarchaeota archaeon]